MPDGQLIEFDHVTKRFGAVVAVSDFSARVNSGVVTGFLGPNGAGKTTTLRMLVGLERPTIGTTKIGGKRFSELREPARVIGAMLENPGFRARRTVERHLIAVAKANSIPLSRVSELISFVGLGDDVETRIAALSLGMRQRLSAATALIGDPGVLVLDEPANGLDPEGIRWMRTLIRGLADEGRTVLVSSHVLSEVEQTADEILVIARGELKFAGTMEDLADPTAGPVVVDAADRSALSQALRGAGFEFEVLRSGLTVRGSDAAEIGAVIAGAGVALTTLQQRGPTLEDVFLDLVNDRYVRADKPATGETALFEMPEATESTTDESAPNESTPNESTTDESTTDESAPDESERVETSDPEAPASDEPAQDDRPLPGLADLAAVASMFANPVTENSASAALASADAEESANAASEDNDDDATRIIDVVPASDAPESDDPENDDPESDDAESDDDSADHTDDSTEGNDGSAEGDADQSERSEDEQR